MDLFKETETEKWAAEMGLGPDLNELKSEYLKVVKEICDEATIELPQEEVFQYGGKEGRHSEYLGYILTDFQYMQRAYPNMKW